MTITINEELGYTVAIVLTLLTRCRIYIFIFILCAITSRSFERFVSFWKRGTFEDSQMRSIDLINLQLHCSACPKATSKWWRCQQYSSSSLSFVVIDSTLRFTVIVPSDAKWRESVAEDTIKIITIIVTTHVRAPWVIDQSIMVMIT